MLKQFYYFIIFSKWSGIQSYKIYKIKKKSSYMFRLENIHLKVILIFFSQNQELLKNVKQILK